MTRIQHRLSAVLMAAMLCSVSWVYGGSKKPGGVLKHPVLPVSVCQSTGQIEGNESAGLAALDASTPSPWTGGDRQQAQALFDCLKERRIAIQPTFYKMLGKAPPARRGQLANRCQVFFNSVDTQEIPNTGCLSSMLKTKKQVCAFLSQSDDWVRRVARTRVLKSLTSLFNGQGFPNVEEDTQAFVEWDIWWQGQGKARTLDRELLRAFASMFHCRGLPDKQAVEDYLQRDVWWQGEGEARTLDRELLRVFSSMFHGRGLPGKQAVEDYLQLDVWWSGDGKARTLDRGLLRAFSSMFSGKGLPDKKAVKDYLRLDVWWQGEGEARILDRELLRAFSSMFNGRGLPGKKAVEDYLQLDVWWQEKGEMRTLDRGLLRVFSSMFNGKGLPDKKTVEDYLQLDVWWQKKGGVRILDRGLLRAFSSMFSGRRLPDKKAVKDYLQLEMWWQGEGEARALDRELLHAFASMFHGRGLPNKKAVQDYLQWDVWWQGEGEARTLDRELLRVFSSMFHGRGIPDKQAVEDYLQRDAWWQGEGEARTLDRGLLRAFSAMFSGKGLPDKRRVDDILQWLTCDGQVERQAIKVMGTLYSSAYASYKSLGLPDINTLRWAEQKLTTLIPSAEWKQDEDNEILPLIKMVALYLANGGGTRQLHWSDCEVWLSEHPDPVPKKPLLRQLLLTLHYHGGLGIKKAVTLISGKPAGTKRFVLEAMGRGQALASVQYALRAIEPSEWRDYLFFTRELHPLPSGQRWQTIKGYRDALCPVLPNQEYRRQFLTLIWPFAVADRERFVQPEAVSQLTALFPSIQALRKLSKSLTTDELRTLLDTCLAYRTGQPGKDGWPILFKALLLAQLPLFDHVALPPGALAQTYDQPEGVVIGINPISGVEDSVTLFTHVMATLLAALWDCQYTVNGPTLILWPHGETKPITLPTPSLAWHSDGVQIRHWTLAHLHRFYQATERWPGLYQAPVEPSDDIPIAPPAHSVPPHLVPPHSSATWLETVLKQSVLSQADIDQLYGYRDQLTSDQVVDVLFRMDQSVSQETAQRWRLLLGDKYQQDLTTNPPWLDGSHQALEAVRDCENILIEIRDKPTPSGVGRIATSP